MALLDGNTCICVASVAPTCPMIKTGTCNTASKLRSDTTAAPIRHRRRRSLGGGGVYSESHTRGARFLTRWDQQAVAQEEKEEEEVIDVIGGVYSESYTRGARFLLRWDQHAVLPHRLSPVIRRDPHPDLQVPAVDLSLPFAHCWTWCLEFSTSCI